MGRLDPAATFHRAGASARRGGKGGSARQGVGRSRGDFTTKVHLRVNAWGLPMRTNLTPGQTFDHRGFDLVMGDDLVPGGMTSAREEAPGADERRALVAPERDVDAQLACSFPAGSPGVLAGAARGAVRRGRQEPGGWRRSWGRGGGDGGAGDVAGRGGFGGRGLERENTRPRRAVSGVRRDEPAREAGRTGSRGSARRI